MSTQQRPSIWGILSDTWRIIIAQPRHYSALSILFVLPITLSPVIHPFLLRRSSIHHPYEKSQSIIKIILYFLLVLLFSLFAGASITYTTSRRFNGKSVRFTSSLKSIQPSFFPLLATKLVALTIVGLIIFGFGVFLMLAYKGILQFGVEIDYSGRYFLIAALLMAVAIYFQVGWYLTTVVVVVESRWGLAALRRSWYLVKGVRWLVFSMILLFGVWSAIMSNWCLILVISGSRNGWRSWEIVVQMAVCVGFWTLQSVYSTAATTVLFIYCKALHGEETAPFQIVDEEFGPEYVRLPFD